MGAPCALTAGPTRRFSLPKAHALMVSGGRSLVDNRVCDALTPSSVSISIVTRPMCLFWFLDQLRLTFICEWL